MNEDRFCLNVKRSSFLKELVVLKIVYARTFSYSLKYETEILSSEARGHFFGLHVSKTLSKKKYIFLIMVWILPLHDKKIPYYLDF